ncbi:MAG: hypothetical protein PHU93_02785 [Candidatus Gracilibacteria bacterium]|nr:hypothetical protein [Candidatus Gracilibacteria bacterium]
MFTQAQQYFYSLLLKRPLVRESIRDIFEATLYVHDDVDISDAKSWQPFSSSPGILDIFSKKGNMLEKWDISPEDSASLTQLFFGTRIESSEALFQKIDASESFHHGLVFRIIQQAVLKNIQISDDLFVIFISSQTKEEMELIMSEIVVTMLQILESEIRNEISSYQSFTEKISQNKDFLDDTELQELTTYLVFLVTKISETIEKDETIQEGERKFQSFWKNLPK